MGAARNGVVVLLLASFAAPEYFGWREPTED